jgi:hypothetical protein
MTREVRTEVLSGGERGSVVVGLLEGCKCCLGGSDTGVFKQHVLFSVLFCT